MSESVLEKWKWIGQVLSFLTEFTIVCFAQCIVEERTVHVKIRKQERILRIQSTYYKVWSIISIIPSAQLIHQHNYSITFFFSPWALFFEQRSHSSGEICQIYLNWGAQNNYSLWSTASLLPSPSKNIASWPAGKGQGPVRLVLTQRLWEVMWVCGKSTCLGVWSLSVWSPWASLFPSLESESVSHSVVSSSLCPMDCSAPGSSVHEIL